LGEDEVERRLSLEKRKQDQRNKWMMTGGGEQEGIVYGT